MSKCVVSVPFASLQTIAAPSEAGAKASASPFEYVPERSRSQMPEQDLSVWTPFAAAQAIAAGIAAFFRPAELRPIRIGKDRRD